MTSRLVFLSFLFLIVMFVYGKSPDTSDNNKLDSSAKGRALIEVPIIGSILFFVSKFRGLLVPIISAIIRLKLVAVSFILNIPSLIYQHCIPIAITTVAIIGYCAVTAMTSVFYSPPVEEYALDHRLFYAARSLEQANNRYIGLQ